jgi:hypothetical protein
VRSLSTSIAALSFFAVTAVQAGVVYNNPTDLSTGDCSFSTNCAAVVGRGNDFAGQAFSLSNATVIQSASFVELRGSSAGVPTGINWMILNANGGDGAPGTLVASGSNAPVAQIDPHGTNYGYIGEFISTFLASL